MSLCPHFDCAVVLSRAEDNCLLVIEKYLKYYVNVEWNKVWQFFLLELQFDFQQLKAACIPRLAKLSTIGGGHKAELESIRATLDKNTMFEIMQTAFALAMQPGSSK